MVQTAPTKIKNLLFLGVMYNAKTYKEQKI